MTHYRVIFEAWTEVEADDRKEAVEKANEDLADGKAEVEVKKVQKY